MACQGICENRTLSLFISNVRDGRVPVVHSNLLGRLLLAVAALNFAIFITGKRLLTRVEIGRTEIFLIITNQHECKFLWETVLGQNQPQITDTRKILTIFSNGGNTMTAIDLASLQ